MSWDSLISLFPFPTFRQQKMHNFSPVEHWIHHIGEDLKNLDENGWPLEDLLVAKGHDQEDYLFLHELWTRFRLHRSLRPFRYVGDKYSYRIRLDTGGINVSTDCVPSNVLGHCEFSFNGDIEEAPLELVCNPVSHPLLKWHYTAAIAGERRHTMEEEYLAKGSIFLHVLFRLQSLMPFEVAKLPEAQRPPQFRRKDLDPFEYLLDAWQRWSSSRSGYWKKPPSWHYVDHAVPQWVQLYAAQREPRERQGLSLL
ncbi:hypothetical protein MBLNU457_1144t2 [Dothideomycetes sp. NU457]